MVVVTLDGMVDNRLIEVAAADSLQLILDTVPPVEAIATSGNATVSRERRMRTEIQRRAERLAAGMDHTGQ